MAYLRNFVVFVGVLLCLMRIIIGILTGEISPYVRSGSSGHVSMQQNPLEFWFIVTFLFLLAIAGTYVLVRRIK